MKNDNNFYNFLSCIMMCGVEILEPVTSHIALYTKMAIKYTNEFYLEMRLWNCEFYYEEVWGWIDKAIR